MHALMRRGENMLRRDGAPSSSYTVRFSFAYSAFVLLIIAPPIDAHTTLQYNITFGL